MTPEQKEALKRAAIARAKSKAAPKADTSFMGRVKDNVIGVDDGVDSFGERLGSTLNDTGKSLISGVGEGIMGLVTLPSSIGGLMDAGFERMTGIDTNPPGSIPSAGAIAQRAYREGVAYEPQTTAGEFGRTIGNYLPGIALGGTPASMIAAGIGDETAGQMTEGTALEPYARFGGAMVGGITGGALESKLARNAAARDFVRKNASTQDLFDDAVDLYEKGHARNVQIKPEETAQLAGKMQDIASRQGLISPSGQVLDDSSVRQALSWIDDFQTGNVNTRQTQTLRGLLGDMAGKKDKTIAKAGVEMKKALDDFLEPKVPEFKEANALLRRAKLGEQVDTIQELALDTAENYSQSGLDNALRQEFRKLNRRIIQGKEKGLRPDQTAAIAKAVSPGTIHNVARTIGKAAPRGAISFGLVGAPAAVGTMTGSPLAGVIASGLLGGTGFAGQGLATTIRRKAVEQAAATMRSASPMKLPGFNMPVMPTGVMGLANSR